MVRGRRGDAPSISPPDRVMVAGARAPALVKALDRSGQRAVAHLEPLPPSPASKTLLAERLVEHTLPDTVFFCNSGNRGDPNWPFKMARKYWHDSDHARAHHHPDLFEGRVPRRVPWPRSRPPVEKATKGFGPLLPGFRQLPFADHERACAKRPPHRMSAPFMVENPCRAKAASARCPTMLKGLPRPVRPSTACS